MQKQISTPKSKVIIDILMLLFLIATFFSGEIEQINAPYWNSFHCIIGGGWCLLIAIHIIQHWNFVKALMRPNVCLKNKTTAIITLFFIVMLYSIITWCFAIDEGAIRFHHVFGKVFPIFAIIHTIQKFKRFISLWKKP